MRNRTLVLRREALTALSTDDLASVVGGTHIGCTVGHGPSFDQSCPTPTLPINDCAAGLTDSTCLTISPDVCVWTMNVG